MWIGRPAVDQLGGENPAEVVRGEAHGPELRAVLGEFLASPPELMQHGGGRDHPPGGAVPALEQERQRRAPDLAVVVEALDQLDRPAPARVPPDDRGDDVEQLGAHGDHALAASAVTVVGGGDAQVGASVGCVHDSSAV
ncbi:hypothetical protein [Planomonospora sphaerica]|uniref:hypothetical protein n=1 Tax=Planomonospora sphaerica TaxID=161355 RepID=UPI0018D11BDE|nr:hypothetical protein [Planomonospora sphaerica]